MMNADHSITAFCGPHASAVARSFCRPAGALAVAWVYAAVLGCTALPSWAAEPAASNGHALAKRHGCLGCHAVQAQLVGPAYEAVAQRYRDDKAAAAELAQRIRAGSDGRWGAVAMPPQAQVSVADARRMARWILEGAR